MVFQYFRMNLWSVLIEETFLKEYGEMEILEKLIFMKQLELAARP